MQGNSSKLIVKAQTRSATPSKIKMRRSLRHYRSISRSLSGKQACHLLKSAPRQTLIRSNYLNQTRTSEKRHLESIRKRFPRCRMLSSQRAHSTGQFLSSDLAAAPAIVTAVNGAWIQSHKPSG